MAFRPFLWYKGFVHGSPISICSFKEVMFEFAHYALKQISIGMPLFGANTFGPLEKIPSNRFTGLG